MNIVQNNVMGSNPLPNTDAFYKKCVDELARKQTLEMQHRIDTAMVHAITQMLANLSGRDIDDVHDKILTPDELVQWAISHAKSLAVGRDEDLEDRISAAVGPLEIAPWTAEDELRDCNCKFHHPEKHFASAPRKEIT